MINWANYTFSGKFAQYHHERKKWSWAQVGFLVVAAAVDCALFLGVSIAIYIVIGWRLLETPLTPFSCADSSIRNPLYDNTVSTVPLLLLTLFGPVLVVFVGLFIAHGSMDKMTVVSVISYSVFLFLDYAMSYWLFTLVLEILKCSVGRLRPNFIAMCKPNVIDQCDSNPTLTISNYLCTNEYKYARNSRASFPSGHSGASVFALVFLYMFLAQKTFIKRIPHNLSFRVYRATVLICFFVFTVFCCYSRVTDFWHFPTDVLGGVTLGTVFALGSFKMFRRPKSGM